MWSRIPSCLQEDLLDFVEFQTREVAQSDKLLADFRSFGRELFCNKKRLSSCALWPCLSGTSRTWDPASSRPQPEMS
eukprot:12570664-Heterocapsa_arctica.AAC.1